MSFILTYPNPGPTPNYNQLIESTMGAPTVGNSINIIITAMGWEWGKGGFHLNGKTTRKVRVNKLFN